MNRGRGMRAWLFVMFEKFEAHAAEQPARLGIPHALEQRSTREVDT